VKEWLAQVGEAWADELKEAFPELAGEIPPRVQTHGHAKDSPERILSAIRYAVDFHWAREAPQLRDCALRFLATLRWKSKRLVRGFGCLSDRNWRDHTEKLPFVHKKLADLVMGDRAAKEAQEGGCPLHLGAKLSLQEVQIHQSMPWSQIEQLAPGIYGDRVSVLEVILYRGGG